ncbi:uncharacterized protein LOC124178051 [Neodiprion fabricii]|uniref:uncharacterized protein LOC124178051 n=1 Tax=Neodiprion fabricii TaxID=2872261 RepID=UPI001ED97B7B|nr:uncharacterized protein LOC124178051 [Neodiprion fabricii]
MVKTVTFSLLYCLSFYICRISCDLNEISWPSVSEASNSGSTEIEIKHSLFDDPSKRAVAVVLPLDEEKPQVENHQKKKRCRKNRRHRKMKLRLDPNDVTDNNKDNLVQTRYRKKISSAEMEGQQVPSIRSDFHENTKRRVDGSKEFQDIDESLENPFMRISENRGSHRSNNEKAEIGSFEKNDEDVILRRIRNHIINPGDYKVLALVGKKDDYSPPQNPKKYICYCREDDCSGKDCQPEIYKPCSGSRKNSRPTPINNYGSNKVRNYSPSNAKHDNKNYVQTLAKVNVENSGMNHKILQEEENNKNDFSYETNSNQNIQAQKSTVNLDQQDQLSVKNSQRLATSTQQGVSQIRTPNNNQWLRPDLGIKGSPIQSGSQGSSQEFSRTQTDATLSWLPFLKDQSTKGKNEDGVLMAHGQVPLQKSRTVQLPSVKEPVPSVEKPFGYLENPESYVISYGDSTTMESSTEKYQQSEENRGYDSSVESNVGLPVSSEEYSSDKFDASTEGNLYLQVDDGPESDEVTKVSVPLNHPVNLPHPENHDDDVYLLGDSTEELTGHKEFGNTPQKYELSLTMPKDDEYQLETDQLRHKMSGLGTLRPGYNPLPPGSFAHEFRRPYNGYGSYVVSPNTQPSWKDRSGYLTTEIPFRAQLERPAIARSGWNECNVYPTAQLWPYKGTMQTPNNYYGIGIGGPALRNFGYYGNPHAGKPMEDKSHLYYSPMMKTGNGGSGLAQQRRPAANDNRDDYSDIQVVTNGYFTSKTYDDVEDVDGNDDQETGNAQAKFESNVDRIHHLTQQGFAYPASNLYNGYEPANDWKAQKENFAVFDGENSRYLESVEDDDEMENPSAVSAEANTPIVDEDLNISTVTEESSSEESSPSEDFTGENQSKDLSMNSAVHQSLDLLKKGNTSRVETVGGRKIGIWGTSDSLEAIRLNAESWNEQYGTIRPEENISSDSLEVSKEKTSELIENGSRGLESKYADSKNDNGQEVGSYYKADCHYPTSSLSDKKYSENIVSAENEGNAEQQDVSNLSPPIIIEPIVAIETSPTKYFSPNDRVLEYIKNHGQNLLQHSDPSSLDRQDAVNQEDHMSQTNETKDQETFVQNPQYVGEYSQMSTSENTNSEEITNEKSENRERIFAQPSIPEIDEIDEDSVDSTERFDADAENESEEKSVMTSEYVQRPGKYGVQDKISPTDLSSLKNEASEDLSRSYEDCTVESAISEVLGETRYPDSYISESMDESTECSQLEDSVSNDHLDMENYGSESMVKNSQENIQQYGTVDAGGEKNLNSYNIGSHDYNDENLQKENARTQEASVNLVMNEYRKNNEESNAESDYKPTTETYADNKRLLVGEFLNPSTGKIVQEVNSRTEMKPEDHDAVEDNGMQLTVQSSKLEDKTDRKWNTAQHRVDYGDGKYSSSLKDDNDYGYVNLGEDSNTRKHSEKLGAVSLDANEGEDRNEMSTAASVKTTPSVSCSCRVPEGEITTETYRNNEKLSLSEVLEPTVEKDVQDTESMNTHKISDDKANSNSQVPSRKSTTEAYEESRKLLLGEFVDPPTRQDVSEEGSLNAYSGKYGESNFGNNPTPGMSGKVNGFVGIQSTTKNSKIDHEVNRNAGKYHDYRTSGQYSSSWKNSGELQSAPSLTTDKYSKHNKKSNVANSAFRIPSQKSSTKTYEDKEKQLAGGEFLISAKENVPKNNALNEENAEVELMNNAKNPLAQIDGEMKCFGKETENNDMQSTNEKSKLENETNKIVLQGNPEPNSDSFSNSPNEEDHNTMLFPGNSGEITTKNSEIIGDVQSLGSCIKPPEVQNDSGYLGRIAPQNPTAAVGSFGDLVDSDLYYIGDGVRLPLTIKRLKDGSFALSISEKICQQWAKEKCPCCVPREGKILQEKHWDDKNLDSLMETSRSSLSRRGISADQKSKSDEMELEDNPDIAKGTQLPKKRSIRSITMPVDEFAQLYNLNLNLEDYNVESTAIESTRRHKLTERSKMENDNQAQSSDLVQKIVSINEVPENEKVGVLLSTLQDLIATEPTEISEVVDKLEENMAKEKFRGELGGDNGEEDASGDEAKRLYDYQKNNPVLERIRIIKQLQMGKARCEHRYQKDCDYAITQKTELLTTILRWLKELLLTSQIE